MDEIKQEPVAGASAEPSKPDPKPGDVNGDGKVDFKDYIASAAKAVGGAYQEAADAIKEKAPEFAQKAKTAAESVKDAFVDVAETVKEKSPEYIQKAKDAAGNVKDAFEDAFCHKAPADEAKSDPAAAPQTPDDTQPKA
ncbi:MAG: hypothetical protein LLF75_05615 [Eubacteriales bacterium]|nr:hypothetical protein [Eubacteriales bacterium]